MINIAPKSQSGHSYLHKTMRFSVDGNNTTLSGTTPDLGKTATAKAGLQ
jgi:hypothetical protein